MKYEFLKLVDIFGVAAFSISGVFAAMDKKLDVFGVFVIAFVASIGGGTLRDLLLGDTPVPWLLNLTYITIVVVSATLAVLFKNILKNWHVTLLIFDSLGLGFFTVLGIQKGIGFGLHPAICVGLGTMTACFGGVIRDISLGQIPLIFRKEIYASACIVGGIVYMLLSYSSLMSGISDILCISLIFAIRLLAVRYDLRLPSIYGRNNMVVK